MYYLPRSFHFSADRCRIKSCNLCTSVYTKYIISEPVIVSYNKPDLVCSFQFQYKPLWTENNQQLVQTSCIKFQNCVTTLSLAMYGEPILFWCNCGLDLKLNVAYQNFQFSNTEPCPHNLIIDINDTDKQETTCNFRAVAEGRGVQPPPTFRPSPQNR